MLNSDFSDAKVGDKVTSSKYGYGVISFIKEVGVYPVRVSFEMTENIGYDLLGFYHYEDFLPTLFKGHIDPASFQVSYKTIE